MKRDGLQITFDIAKYAMGACILVVAFVYSLNWLISNWNEPLGKPKNSPEPETIVIMGGNLTVTDGLINFSIRTHDASASIADISMNYVTKELLIKFDPDANIAYMVQERGTTVQTATTVEAQ